MQALVSASSTATISSLHAIRVGLPELDGRWVAAAQRRREPNAAAGKPMPIPQRSRPHAGACAKLPMVGTGRWRYVANW